MLKKGLLGDIFIFENGKSIKPGGIGKYKVYGANGVIGGSDETNKKDAIIIGRVGAYCGAIEQCIDKFWASDNTIVATPNNSDFSKKYSYYLLKFLNLNKYAGGAAQPLLTQSVLKTLEFTFHAQKFDRDKIAFILSAYDDLIENNNRRIAILEEMAQKLYREWFVKFHFPGHENVKMVESELGLIPEGWEVVKLSDIYKRVQVELPVEKNQNTMIMEIFLG